MKNLLFFIAIAITFVSCNKEEFHPYVYPSNPEKVIVGEWKGVVIQKWTGTPGVDQEVEVIHVNKTFVFKDDGNYITEGDEVAVENGEFSYDVSERRLWLYNKNLNLGCCISYLSDEELRIKAPVKGEPKTSYYMIFLERVNF